MLDYEKDLLDLLREARDEAMGHMSEQHSKRTPECPPIGSYARYARTHWSAELEAHAEHCEFCQESVTAVWTAECPGWGVLQRYLQGERLCNRRAVELHMDRDDCAVCSSRVKLLNATDRWQEKIGDWLSFTSPVIAGARAATRTPVRILELLYEPPVVLRIEETDEQLEVGVTTQEPALAGKTVEIRLAGEKYETRLQLSLEASGDAEWTAHQLRMLDMEHFKDLEKSIVSLRIGLPSDGILDNLGDSSEE